jgi:N-acetylmuramoyl-L-alanine amidase
MRVSQYCVFKNWRNGWGKVVLGLILIARLGAVGAEEKSDVKQDEKEVLSTVLPTGRNQWETAKVGNITYVSFNSIKKYHRFESLTLSDRHVWLRQKTVILKGMVGSKEILINNIKFILNYPVELVGGVPYLASFDFVKLIDPVLEPKHIQTIQTFDTVVVDAGHGGHDKGAVGAYGNEKDFALQLALALRDKLMKRGFKVVLTRGNDTFLTLSERVAVANNIPNSIFISLHFNSGGSAATGIETFALTPQGGTASLERGGGYNGKQLSGNVHDSANIALATAVHGHVITALKPIDRGIKRAQWSVLTGCRRPGILFEGGFVSNQKECAVIASASYRELLSNVIAQAVVSYRKALQM